MLQDVDNDDDNAIAAQQHSVQYQYPMGIKLTLCTYSVTNKS